MLRKRHNIKCNVKRSKINMCLHTSIKILDWMNGIKSIYAILLELQIYWLQTCWLIIHENRKFMTI